MFQTENFCFKNDFSMLHCLKTGQMGFALISENIFTGFLRVFSTSMDAKTLNRFSRWRLQSKNNAFFEVSLEVYSKNKLTSSCLTWYFLYMNQFWIHIEIIPSIADFNPNAHQFVNDKSWKHFLPLSTLITASRLKISQFPNPTTLKPICFCINFPFHLMTNQNSTHT